MKTIEIDGKSYLIDMEKAEKAGLLKITNKKPMSWEDYDNAFNAIWRNERKFPAYFTISETQFATEEEAIAFRVLAMLINLRDAWCGEWNYEADSSQCACIVVECSGDICVLKWSTWGQHILQFPTYEMAVEFLQTFRDLIEKAKMFL